MRNKQRNEDIRAALRRADIRQWELAEEIGVSEFTLSRWLRLEMSEEKKAIIFKGIEKLEETE